MPECLAGSTRGAARDPAQSRCACCLALWSLGETAPRTGGVRQTSGDGGCACSTESANAVAHAPIISCLVRADQNHEKRVWRVCTMHRPSEKFKSNHILTDSVMWYKVLRRYCEFSIWRPSGILTFRICYFSLSARQSFVRSIGQLWRYCEFLISNMAAVRHI